MKTKWILASLTALAQKWNNSKTLLITTLAGCGLVLFITAHGFLVAWGGLKLRFAYSERNVSEALIRIGIGSGP